MSTSMLCLVGLLLVGLLLVRPSLPLLSPIRPSPFALPPLRSSSFSSIPPSSLPDSLVDAAASAASSASSMPYSRVDISTNVFDETFSALSRADEFLQRESPLPPPTPAVITVPLPSPRTWHADFVSSLSKDLLPERREEFARLLEGASDPAKPPPAYDGPVVAVYFPDEGSVALARSRWSFIVPPAATRKAKSLTKSLTADGTASTLPTAGAAGPPLPPCVELLSLGRPLPEKAVYAVLSCPPASCAEDAEALFLEAGAQAAKVCLLNENLIDMGVTGVSRGEGGGAERK